ncbi:MAG: DNA-binding domain-containing protein [Immundisolibacter sp.]
MPSLSELQTGVVAAILQGDDTAAAHVRGAGLPPTRRLAVYRNAVRVRLKDALADVYPVLRRLVGDDCFDGIANEYLRRYPPREGWLQSFGAHMAALCADLPVLAGLPYLADVARLEWARQRAWYAPSTAPIGAEAFSAVPASEQAAVCLDLRPGSTLLPSAYPIARIFEVNQPDYTGDDTVDLSQGHQTVLIIRRDTTVCVELLAPAEAALLTVLSKGETLGQALHAAVSTDPDCAAGELLARHVAAGTFATLRAPSATE